MAEPWTFSGESASLGQPGGPVTLVEGASFCLSGRSGDIRPGGAHGLFFLDTRLLSQLELSVDGLAPEPLTVAVAEPFAATYVLRTSPAPGRADSPLLIVRRRYVGRGMREDMEVRNFGPVAVELRLELLVNVDFADLFEVKEGRILSAGADTFRADQVITYSRTRDGAERSVTIEASGDPALGAGAIVWDVVVPARGRWETCLQVTTALGAEPVPPRYRCGEPVEAAAPHTRLSAWRHAAPTVTTDHAPLAVAVRQSVEDLGSLRIFDPEHPERAVIAAGAPWFMTLFGRDSILTAHMALLVDPDLALGVVETLAAFQGKQENPATEEEPGRILHEVRFGQAESLALGGGQIYYGTVDATPLFVMLLGELRRWGLGADVVDRLMPHVDRAMDWIRDYGDRDGDGYVEYQRATEHGLLNQGWKDSWDGVPFAGGGYAEPPVALCEVQGYVYAAYVARAHFADEAGDVATATACRERAATLKEAFNRDFWLPERGWYALALDRDKRPVDALASNMGHCLWTGIVDEAHAAQVAQHLTGDELFSGWGVRTLGRTMDAYNPLSYHCGSVWPHDNALAVAGLVRYGFVEQAHRLMLGLLGAATHYDGRLPELFAGLGRDEVPAPVAYPTSCSPQAWAAATPLLFLRSLLRLDPWLPHGKVWLAPSLPAEIRELTVRGIPLGDARITVHVGDGVVSLDGVPPELQVVTEPRAPLTASQNPGD